SITWPTVRETGVPPKLSKPAAGTTLGTASPLGYRSVSPVLGSVSHTGFPPASVTGFAKPDLMRISIASGPLYMPVTTDPGPPPWPAWPPGGCAAPCAPLKPNCTAATPTAMAAVATATVVPITPAFLQSGSASFDGTLP